jgi:hypothetical protein
MRSISKWLALTVVLSALMVTPAMAQFVAITDATVNYATSPWTMTVIGSGFGTSGTLAINNTQLTASSWSAGQIVAKLPTNVAPGSYLITVRNNYPLSATFDVMIGAAALSALNGTSCQASDGTTSTITVTVLGDGSIAMKCPSSGAKLVFVTSQQYTGNLGGLPGADNICQSLAAAAGLPGVYKAWLSAHQDSPSVTFTHPSGPYKLVNGTVVASSWTALTTQVLQNPINIDETGALAGTDVWTNTSENGTTWSPSGHDCEEWTEASVGMGNYGCTTEACLSYNIWSSADGNATCGTALSFFCFQQ